MSEKADLLAEVRKVIAPIRRLDFNYFAYTMLVILLISLFLFPKIYIQQQIYFKSRDIAKLQAEYDLLKEENKIIRASVESIKFKNQVLETLF